MSVKSERNEQESFLKAPEALEDVPALPPVEMTKSQQKRFIKIKKQIPELLKELGEPPQAGWENMSEPEMFPYYTKLISQKNNMQQKKKQPKANAPSGGKSAYEPQAQEAQPIQPEQTPKKLSKKAKAKMQQTLGQAAEPGPAPVVAIAPQPAKPQATPAPSSSSSSSESAKTAKRKSAPAAAAEPDQQATPSSAHTAVASAIKILTFLKESQFSAQDFIANSLISSSISNMQVLEQLLQSASSSASSPSSAASAAVAEQGLPSKRARQAEPAAPSSSSASVSKYPKSWPHPPPPNKEMQPYIFGAYSMKQ